MHFTLSEAADFVQGKISGNNSLLISGAARIEEAIEGEITFLYNPAYEKYFSSTKASAIVVKPGFNKSRSDISYIEVEHPEKAFYKIIAKYFSPEISLSGIDKTAFIHNKTNLGKNVSVGKNVVISAECKIGNNVKIFHNSVIMENVEIGDDSILFSNVSIRENTKIGKRVIIHSNSVIGSDGFGYYTNEEKKYIKIPQVGNVIIEDDVEVGSNVSIDRAALGSTIIKRGVKIDNLVQVAHNVVIGEDTVISAQSGISGSTKVGRNNILAGQVGLVGHIETADNVIMMAQSGVSKGIPKPGQYFGSPAKELKTALKLEAHLRNLPDYAERIKELELQIKNLQEEIKKISK